MRGIDVPIGRSTRTGRFGRMFPNLESAPDSEELAQILGHPDGPMVGEGGANPKIPAGFTYIGQFIDHDLTYDPTSSLEKLNDPRAIENFRTPALDLDSVYGSGPDGDPYFYEETSPICFRLGNPENTDVLRLRPSGTAVIADPRNDSNFFVSQLHTAFQNFHNYVVTRVETNFSEAQRLVRWHYQWLVLKKYLPAIVSSDIVDESMRYLKFFTKPEPYPFMSIEFSLAAFRFGHSQIRSQYDIGDAIAGQTIPLGNLFGPNAFGSLGKIDWKKIMPYDGSRPRLSRPIGLLLVKPLMDLPGQMIGRTPSRDSAQSDGDSHSIQTRSAVRDGRAGSLSSLPYRDIRRGQLFGLPAGTDVACAMGLPDDQVLAPADVWGLINPILKRQKKDVIPADTPVPLWIYVLAEAQIEGRSKAFGGGVRLGPVAGRIVAEVIVGLLKADSESFLSRHPSWKPTLALENRNPNDFDIMDLLQRAEQGRQLRAT